MDGCIYSFVRSRLSFCARGGKPNLPDRYPVYSFLLPVYSYWRMDDFGWGNTRLVVGEGSSKKVIINEEDKFDDSMIPLKKFSGRYTFCPPRYGA
jgi:hypothetical protein